MSADEAADGAPAAAQLTKQDLVVLKALVEIGRPETPSNIAGHARIRTSAPRETAARHCIRLTGLGLAFKSGSRAYPKWEATFDGRAVILALEPPAPPEIAHP